MSQTRPVLDAGTIAAAGAGSGRRLGVALLVIATAQLMVVMSGMPGPRNGRDSRLDGAQPAMPCGRGEGDARCLLLASGPWCSGS
jgi:hypothetical protein